MPLPRDARIDLHTHSSCSDGTSGVEELIGEARAAGLDVIALTDHDTTDGWDRARAASRRHGVRVVPGIEVSTQHGTSSVHVLALLPARDPADELSREIAASHEARRGRAREMVDRLARDFPISWELVAAQVAGERTTVGRPHIADALVGAGVVPDRSAAFTRILASDSPYYVPHYAPRPHVAVRAIRAAGGVPVLAHPGSGHRGAGVTDDLIGELTGEGLAGIEVDHREHDDAQRARLRLLADRFGLLVTGGSDYHGRGKPNRLGENLTSPDVLEAMISLSTSGTEVLTP